MLIDSRIRNRHLVIPTDSLQKAFDRYDAIISKSGDDVPQLVELLLRSVAVCESHDYSGCLITAWPIIERLLDDNWKTFLKNEVIVRERRKTLKEDHRTYSAAVRIEMLAMKDVISSELYMQTTPFEKGAK